MNACYTRVEIRVNAFYVDAARVHANVTRVRTRTRTRARVRTRALTRKRTRTRVCHLYGYMRKMRMLI